VMKMAESDYLLICDSDIVVPRGWVEDMFSVYNKDFSNIGLVGTAVTGGRQIKEGNYWETDFMTSCCVLLPKATIVSIKCKFLKEKDSLLKKIEEEKVKPSYNYVGYQNHIEKIKNYIMRDTGYWDTAFPYGADDFDFSLLVRWSGLKLAIADTVPIFHRNASQNPSLKEHRDKCVFEGFQYYRTKWSLFENCFGEWDPQLWDVIPMNKEYYRRFKSCSIK